MAESFIGEIRAFPYDYAPDGWALCDGSLLSLSANPALFSLIGTFYGGDGTTNFALPKLTASVVVHEGAGLVMGQVVGEQEVMLTPSTMPGHSHSFQRRGSTTAATDKTSAPSAVSDLGSVTVVNASGIVHPQSLIPGGMPNTSLAPNACGTAGNNLPHENRQPFLALKYCISLEGYYPNFT